ncbi:N-acetylmuramoyl-L-alanine amidase [Rosenbergiella australiborealis]|nr:N-acetylmuramoyl-L-alanine amidase [Rosenbergiella australiborealis]
MKKEFLLFFVLLTGCHAYQPHTSSMQPIINRQYQAIGHQPRIDTLVIHYTVADERRSLALLTGEHVSSHYLIARLPKPNAAQPEIYQLVPESQAAWHAGVSAWRGTNNLNKTSIGIELVNKGFTPGSQQAEGYCQSYPPQQITALIELATKIVKKYTIAPENIVGHSDIAPLRKFDPGPCFPWQQLAEHGLGAWPDPQRVNRLLAGRTPSQPVTNQILLPLLQHYGYTVGEHPSIAQQQQLIRAFQFHFQPENISGKGDRLTLARLQALFLQYPWQQWKEPQ